MIIPAVGIHADVGIFCFAVIIRKKCHYDAFKLCVKPVIGVDEATDYSLIDYYAIASLRHYVVSSITLAGDIMQGLTVNGISDWTHLYDDLIFPEMDRTPLVTSYRQSPSLLSLAQRLYKKQIRNMQSTILM